MIISRLKLGIANKKIAPLLRKRVFNAAENPVRSVAVLLDNTTISSSENFVELKKSLGVEDKEFLMFTCRKSKPDNPQEGIIYCTPKDLNWKGEFTSEKVRDFMQREFDLLICFSVDQTPLMSLLTSASNAALKIGRVGERAGSDFDISIFCRVEEADLFIEEVKKYLEILNKLKNE